MDMEGDGGWGSSPSYGSTIEYGDQSWLSKDTIFKRLADDGIISPARPASLHPRYVIATQDRIILAAKALAEKYGDPEGPDDQWKAFIPFMTCGLEAMSDPI